ncbi:hypothetical protein [Streptomyces sp. NBC_01803]|uniref:hypothetical protein n=1 Tax=Streptomyces sp. NBC_01803 TaxID=2975946 RepID=UPI002DDB777F|nr:hypothetical protein [Streptomyces sp. NBC_01803]WSA44548.1 hypothetical protein OIE51_10220 [Streptomyces sp. NBC_01803]
MMMSFHAQLLSSTEDAHLYRIIMDGGERFAFMVLDTDDGFIVSANSTGDPSGGLRLSLRDGEMQPSADGAADESAEMSWEEFALVSGNIRRAWLKEDAAPTKITKYYG